MTDYDSLKSEGHATDVGAKGKGRNHYSRADVDTDEYRKARRMLMLAGLLFGLMAFIIAGLACTLGFQRGQNRGDGQAPLAEAPPVMLPTPVPVDPPTAARRAELKRQIAELERIRDEQKRSWSSQVIDLASRRYPNPFNPNADYVRVTNSASTGPDNSWVFMLRVIPEDGMRITLPVKVCYEVQSGVLNPEPISEKRFVWKTSTPAEAAEWFIYHDNNDPPEPMEILEVRSPEKGTLTAKLKGQNTARLYRLEVIGFEDSSLVRVSSP